MRRESQKRNGDTSLRSLRDGSQGKRDHESFGNRASGQAERGQHVAAFFYYLVLIDPDVAVAG